MAIMVEISKINAHRVLAGVADGRAGDGFELAAPLVDPDSVWSPIIIADIEIGQAVAVEIPKGAREAPITRRTPEPFTIFVQEQATSPGNGCEAAVTVIRVEQVRFAEFYHAIRCQHEPIAE